MRRIVGTIGATLAVVAVLGASAGAASAGIDNTGPTLAVAGLASPAGGPYFGKLDPAAYYYVKIDNTGDGVEDVAYRWTGDVDLIDQGSALAGSALDDATLHGAAND